MKIKDDRFEPNKNNFNCWEICEFYDEKREQILAALTSHVYELVFNENSQILRMLKKYTPRFVNAKINRFVKNPENKKVLSIHHCTCTATIDSVYVVFWDEHIVIKVHAKWQNSADNTVGGGDFNYAFPIEYHNAIPNKYDEYRFIQKVRAL